MSCMLCAGGRCQSCSVRVEKVGAGAIDGRVEAILVLLLFIHLVGKGDEAHGIKRRTRIGDLQEEIERIDPPLCTNFLPVLLPQIAG